MNGKQIDFTPIWADETWLLGKSMEKWKAFSIRVLLMARNHLTDGIDGKLQAESRMQMNGSINRHVKFRNQKQINFNVPSADNHFEWLRLLIAVTDPKLSCSVNTTLPPTQLRMRTKTIDFKMICSQGN